MSSDVFVVNSNMKVNIMKVGVEKTPIIIIDDFALTTDLIKDFANEKATFSPDNKTLYPGVRCPLPEQYILKLLQSIYQPLYNIYGIQRNKHLKPLHSFLSLLTSDPSTLPLLQRLPHFDTTNSHCFAVLHYLSDGVHGGTGLFRHKPTHFERITDDRYDRYIDSSNLHIEQFGEPKSGYITSSTDHYEKYYEVDFKPNRLVIYPSNLLHSIIVDIDNDISADPNKGRLTANIFIKFQ